MLSDIFSASCSIDLLPYKKIYAPKKRSFLPKRFEAAWPENGMIGLPVSQYSQTPKGVLGPDHLGRIYIDRRDVVKKEMQPFVPFIGMIDFTPFYVDMIPLTSWGASLANLLTLSSWNALRSVAIRESGHVCKMCGLCPGPLECHEIWRFHDNDGVEDSWYRQSLEGILTVCKPCHEMFHPGRANVIGRREAVIKRRCIMNEWSLSDYEIAENLHNKLFYERSQKTWSLDLTFLKDRDTLKLSKKWSHVDEYGTLFCESKQSVTRIVGADYSF